MSGPADIISLYADLLERALPFLFYIAPIFTTVIIWYIRLYFLRYNYIKKLEWVLLEIRMPKEIAKSPTGMEVIFSTLHQTSDGNIIDKYMKGKLRSWFSLEMCSFGGTVKFFIRMEKKYRNLFEATCYAQYPEVEIHEVEDYVHSVPFGLPGSTWDMWGVVFELTKPDPYPIKTYVDYGLDKKEKDALVNVDPLTPIIEFLGSIQPNEQVWVHIPIMAAKRDWKKEGEKLIDDVLHRDPKTKVAKQVVASEGEFKFPNPVMPSKVEVAVSEALQRMISKQGFEVGIRVLYFAEEGINNNYKPAIQSMIKQFNSETLNGFKRREGTDFDYPWQDLFGLRLARMKARYFNASRLRSYFYTPYVDPSFVLTTEELATVFHFPGGTSQTPTFQRIMSKRAEPPANLPI